MSKRWRISVILSSLSLWGCGSGGGSHEAPAPPAPPPPSSAPVEPAAEAPAIRLEAGRLVNDDARYSFDLPEGWAPRNDSRAELVILDRAGTDAALAILVKPAASDAAGEALALRDLLAASPMAYEVLSEREQSIAGRPARDLLTRCLINGQPRVTRHVVVVERDLAFVLGCEMAEPDQPQLEPELDQLLASFRLD